MVIASPEPGFRNVLLERKLGDPKKVVGDARGQLRLWAPEGKRVVVTLGSGHGAAEFAAPFLAFLEEAIASGALEVWSDWAAIRSYEPGARVHMTKWTKARPEIAKQIHVLVESKLVAMGITVANLALGNPMEVLSDRARFERAVLARI